MPKTYLELGGYDKGQAILRFKDMPEAYTCYNTTPGGSATAVLTPVGRCKFANPDLADDAIASAISSAFSDMGSKGGTWCVGETCFNASGFGTGTAGDYSASASISAGLAYQQGDPLCDPAGTSPPSGGGGGGFEFTVIGPGNTGVDLRQLVESVNLDAIPGLPTIYRDAADKFIEDVLQGWCLVDTPSFDDGTGIASVQPQPDGYPNAGYIGVSYNSDYVQLVLIVPPYVPGVSNPYTLDLGGIVTYVSGTWVGGGTVAGSGLWMGIEPSAVWGGTGVPVDSPGLFPSTASYENVNSPIAVTLSGNPVVEPTGVWQWGYTEINTAGGGSDFEGTGTWGLNPVMEFPVVWNDPDCLVNLYYTNRRRLLIRPDIRCMNEFQLMFTPDTTWPKGFTPACRVWVSVPPIPAGA